MKILITERLGANSYIGRGWANAFNSIGHETIIWDEAKVPCFDAFKKFEPDVFLTSSWQLSRPQIKCIASRPNLKVIVSLSNYGDDDAHLDSKKVHIASDEEKKNVEELVKLAPWVNVGISQYNDKYMKHTHNKWVDLGITPHGLMLGADVVDFPLTAPSKEYKCDLFIVSGRWAEKAKELDRYLLSLTYPNTTLDIKIFGNGWGSIPQAYGYIPNELIKHYYASATVSPNIHEPQALESGIDVNQRSFQSISSGGFQISQRVRSMEEDIFFNNEVVFVDNEKEFLDQVLFFRENPQERLPYIQRGLDTVYENHTFTHRIAEMLSFLGNDSEADKALDMADVNYHQMKKTFSEIYGAYS